MKDPDRWIEDLEFYMDDEELRQSVAAVEPTALYVGSKAAAGAWVGVLGAIGGAFGALTLSPAIREPLTFVGYVVLAAVLLRGLYPLTVRLLGRAIAWLAMLSFFWAVLLGLTVVLGSRFETRWIAYSIGVGGAAFIGLMYGALPPGLVKRQEIWMMVSLPLAPTSAALALYFLRRSPVGSDTMASAALAGAFAGGLLECRVEETARGHSESPPSLDGAGCPRCADRGGDLRARAAHRA